MDVTEKENVNATFNFSVTVEITGINEHKLFVGFDLSCVV